MNGLSPIYSSMPPPDPSDHAATLKRLLSRQASWHERTSRASHTKLGNVGSPPFHPGHSSPEGTPASSPRVKGLRLSDGLHGFRSGSGAGWSGSGGYDEDHLRRAVEGGHGSTNTSTSNSTMSSAYTSPDITRPSSRAGTPTEETPPSGPGVIQIAKPLQWQGEVNHPAPINNFGYPSSGLVSSPHHGYLAPTPYQPYIHGQLANFVPVIEPSYNFHNDSGPSTHMSPAIHSNLCQSIPMATSNSYVAFQTSSLGQAQDVTLSTPSVGQFQNGNDQSTATAAPHDGADGQPGSSSGINQSNRGGHHGGDPDGNGHGNNGGTWGENENASGEADELGDGGDEDDGGEGGKRKAKGAAKKKAAKACLQCQKAHLTCDDARPCTRCVSKGIGDSCEEGRRKKAKYLMTEEEKALAAPRKRPNPAHSDADPTILRRMSDEGDSSQNSPPHEYAGSPFSVIPPLTAVMPRMNAFDPSFFDQMQGQSGGAGPALLPQSQPFLSQPMLASGSGQGMGYFGDGMPQNDEFIQDSDPIFNLNFDPNYQFGSQAANLEYTMLSSMFADAAMNTPTDGFDNSLFQLDGAWPATEAPQLGNNGADLMGGVQQDVIGGHALEGPPFSLESIQDASSMGTGPDGRDPMAVQNQYNPHNPFSNAARIQQQDMAMDSPGGSTLTQNTQASASLRMITPSMVYSQVTRPYDYTEGYHYLMRYLAKHFDQSEALKVVKSLAAFRPSLIALQMPLTIEDEVFLEKSFQRTLIELEKLLSFSGTPTAVWRRTGELCLVSEEFCRLVQMSKTQLLGKKTYVYELFENQSVIDYFERFSQHAFENTTQNFFMRCGLVTSQTKVVACSCSFTIRRDVFDLPSAVIGQVLPVEP